MTEDERIREQGRMVEERRDVKARLACLENKARRIEIALERAGTAVRQSHVDNWRADPSAGGLELVPQEHERRRSGHLETVSYPDLPELAEFLQERRALRERLDELDRLLDL